MRASEWAFREEGLDSARRGNSGIKAEAETTPPRPAPTLCDKEEQSGSRALIKCT